MHQLILLEDISAAPYKQALINAIIGKTHLASTIGKGKIISYTAPIIQNSPTPPKIQYLIPRIMFHLRAAVRDKRPPQKSSRLKKKFIANNAHLTGGYNPSTSLSHGKTNGTKK
jgi:hypothetical protein